jgi:hypothetical protein
MSGRAKPADDFVTAKENAGSQLKFWRFWLSTDSFKFT